MGKNDNDLDPIVNEERIVAGWGMIEKGRTLTLEQRLYPGDPVEIILKGYCLQTRGYFEPMADAQSLATVTPAVELL